MKMDVSEMLDKVLDQLQKEVNTETVIGKEFQLGEYKAVPVMKVGMGFGGGGGTGEGGKAGSGSGGGAGAGIGIAPIGFLVTKGDEIKMVSASGKGFSAMLEKIPGVIEKAIELRYGKETEEKKEEPAEA